MSRIRKTVDINHAVQHLDRYVKSFVRDAGHGANENTRELGDIGIRYFEESQGS